MRLPVRQFSSSDGLAQGEVHRVAFDPLGFLWIPTSGGLSSFDGQRFTTYGPEDGLTAREIDDIAFGADGTYWVATSEGLFRFEPTAQPEGAPLFRPFVLDPSEPDRRVFRLAVDARGAVWAGTLRDLWRIEGSTPVQVPLPAPPAGTSRIQSLVPDPAGNMWVGTHLRGIFRVAPDGTIDHLPPDRSGADFVRDFAFDRDGGVWTAIFGGVARFDGDPFGDESAPQYFSIDQGLPGSDTTSLLFDGDDRLLVGCIGGIAEMRRGADGSFSVGATLDRRSGLHDDLVVDLALDEASDLWVGLASHGVARVVERGIVLHEEVDQPGFQLVSLVDDRKGGVTALAASGRMELTVWQLEDGLFRPHQTSLPPAVDYLGWGTGQRVLKDRRGAWWLTTGRGLARWDDPRGAGALVLERSPDAFFRVAQGLPGNALLFVTEDRSGRLWSGGAPSPGHVGLASYDAARDRFSALSLDGFGESVTPYRSFADRAGALWVSFFGGRLFRVGADDVVGIDTRAVLGFDANGITEDPDGALWIVGRGGLAVCRDPTAPVPLFSRVDASAEIESTETYCLVGDDAGNLWIGTGRGLLRLEPDRGGARWFTVEDGLPGNVIQLCHRDAAGRLWFSDLAGLVQITPQPDPPPRSVPAARLRSLRVAGEAVPLAALGTTDFVAPPAPAGRGRVEFEFFTIHQGTNPPPRFQFQLEGLDDEWGPPGTGRSVRYASLAPGRYRFVVRTVAADGRLGQPPATVEFRVLAPFWRQAWFLALAVLLLGATTYAGYRLRVERLLALERVRTRIATDLHDDVGSGLSQIAVLSQLAARGPDTGATLERITELSRELVGSMSDVVWAIDPRVDRLADMVRRMRRFATELFSDQAAELQLDLAEDEGNERLDPALRRALYLVFKEALNNAARHAQARTVRATLRRDGGLWTLRVCDDGVGLSAARGEGGRGLASMRRRAAAFGATLETLSPPGGGTEIVLRLSLSGGKNLFKRIVGGRPRSP